MSKGIPQVAVRNTWVWLAITVLLPAVMHAADPSAPPGRDAKAVKPATAQPSVQPPPRPAVRPAGRTPASFTREMPLGEAVDILRNCTIPPLPIVVLWRDLDSAGIYSDTPIGIDGLPGLRIRQYLDMLVASLSAGAPAKVDYVVNRGVITIATTSALPVPKQITRVYDISDLTAPPSSASFSPMGFGGMGYGSYGGQMMGPGMGYGMGSSYMPGRYGIGGAENPPGLIGGSTGIGPGAYRGR